ncbi:MAG: Tol biopolymer transport system component/DNA-binding winged helix-turn-helix (wHTH) protein [Candidatus Krumholzibacteriia bacterium]|jgi:Tol biopolymer transport system component/DNA-binding winged helix-turn-helix (wHTH) protein
MNHPETFRPPFRLNQWLVQPDLNRISGPDGTTQVEPRVMAVLLALAQRPGDVLTRLELLDLVWGDTVVGEEILTRAVSELRRVFGDKARKPEYIETIRNHGYRLIAPVTEAENETVDQPTPPRNTEESSQSSPVGSWVRLVIVVGLLIFLAISVPSWMEGPSSPDTAPSRQLVATPLTTFSGREYHPALSSDGTRVAFAWLGLEGDMTSIHVKQSHNEAPLRLTHELGWAAWPAWSPDDQTVAFVQSHAQASDICLVPSLGGAVRRIYSVAGLIEGLDWSPDNTLLAFSARDSASGDHRIYVLDLSSLKVRAAVATRTNNAGDFLPRFAPQDSRLAWIGRDRSGGSGVYVASSVGGAGKAATLGREPLQGLAWTADGASLIYAAETAGKYRLRQVAAIGGLSHELPLSDDFAWNPTVARLDGSLVYEQVRVDQDLWRTTITNRADWTVESGSFITSTRWESDPEYHPDGGLVAFVSTRSGEPQIWVGDAQGTNLRQLTTWDATAITNLRWSPAGDAIACNAVLNDEHQIRITDATGGQSNRVTTGHENEVFASWSRGDVLVSAQTQSGWQVMRLPLGGAKPTQITRSGGLIAQEDATGRVLYFTRPDRAGLWRSQIGGRVTPELVLPEILPDDQFNWRLLGDKVVWVHRTRGTALLYEYDLALDQSVLLAELAGYQGPGLAIAPSGNTFLYPKTGAAAGDLMLVKGWPGNN